MATNDSSKTAADEGTAADAVETVTVEEVKSEVTDGGDANEDKGSDKTDDAAQDEAGKAENPDAVKSLLKEERKKARTANAELAELRSKLKTFEDEKLSETEKLTRDRDELKEKYEALSRDVQETKARSAVTEAASKLGAVNIKAILRLVDLSEFDHEDDNSSDLVKAAKAEYPELFQKAKVDADVTAGKNQPGPAVNPRKTAGAFLRGA